MATTGQNAVNQGAAARYHFDPAQAILNLATSAQTNSVKIERSTAAAFNKYKPYLKDLQQATNSAVGGIQAAEKSVNNFVDDAFATLDKELGGFSDVTGQMLGTAAGIIKNPLDINNIGNSITSLLNTVSPGLGNRTNQSLQNLNLSKMAKAPGMLFSSAERMVKAADNLLSIPLSYISSIYFGLMVIIQQIGKSLNSIISNFFTELLKFADPVITGVLDLLKSISTLASQIQGIASVFMGVNNISQIALQITTASTQLQSAIQNPLNTVIGVLPTDISKGISQIMYGLNNPQQLINQFLPPQLSQSFAQISKITGYGFNGNMGFGFGSVIQGMQGGVISNILKQFSNQYGVLGPLLAGNNTRTPAQVGGNPALVNGYNPGLNNRNYSGVKQWIDKDTGKEVRRAEEAD